MTSGSTTASVRSRRWAVATSTRCPWTEQPKSLSVSTMASLPGTAGHRQSTCIHRVLSPLLLLRHHNSPPAESKATGVARKLLVLLLRLVFLASPAWGRLPHTVSSTHLVLFNLHLFLLMLTFRPPSTRSRPHRSSSPSSFSSLSRLEGGG